jgi:hypothetical protein
MKTPFAASLCLMLSACAISPEQVDVATEVAVDAPSIQTILPSPPCGAGRTFHIYHVLISPSHAVTYPWYGWIVRTTAVENDNPESPALYFHSDGAKNIELQILGGVPAYNGHPGNDDITMWLFAAPPSVGDRISFHISGACKRPYVSPRRAKNNYLYN